MTLNALAQSAEPRELRRIIIGNIAPFAVEDHISTTLRGPIKRLVSTSFRDLIGACTSDGIITPHHQYELAVVSVGGLDDTDVIGSMDTMQYHLPDDTVALIQHMIAQQPHGEEGDLVTNGSPNLFYTMANGRKRVGYATFYSETQHWAQGCLMINEKSDPKEGDGDDQWPEGTVAFMKVS